MGLNVSHGCWSGPYSAFHRWRCAIAQAAGLPPLELMEGFYESGPHGALFFGSVPSPGYEAKVKRITDSLPIRWECLAPNPLFLLLHHSDCDGVIRWSDCQNIADALSALLHKLPSDWQRATRQFIVGLELAACVNEYVEFQ